MMTGIQVDPFSPSEWDVASFINDQHHRGQSGPKRMLHALTWAEKAFDINLCTRSPLVQAQRMAASPEQNETVPKSATMATIEMFNVTHHRPCCDAGQVCTPRKGMEF